MTVNHKEEIEEAKATAKTWFELFSFQKYVGSGYETELEGVSEDLIWTEWADGLNGDYAANEFNTGDSARVPQGYYVMAKPYSFEKSTVFIATTLVLDCDQCNGDDDCEVCEGEGSVFVELT